MHVTIDCYIGYKFNIKKTIGLESYCEAFNLCAVYLSNIDYVPPPTFYPHELMHVCEVTACMYVCMYVYIYTVCVFIFVRLTMAADLDMVNLFVIAGGTLAIPILAFVVSFLLWPSALIKVYYW